MCVWGGAYDHTHTQFARNFVPQSGSASIKAKMDGIDKNHKRIADVREQIEQVGTGGCRAGNRGQDRSKRGARA